MNGKELMSADGRRPKYLIVTAAYNEEAHIEKVIRSVVAQTIPPSRWIIVSDGSTDATDELVEAYAKDHAFILPVRIAETHARNFAAQVAAINLGIARASDLDYDFVGNLDADVSFQHDYFERLLGKFAQDRSLGLAGGWICEANTRVFHPRPTNSSRSVAHAVQLFRRECFQQCGGYVPLPYGGPDWLAELRCRMEGWTVRSFPELRVHHHRPTSSAGGRLRGWFRQGLMDHSFGSHPAFEAVKLIRRLRCRPYVIGALARFYGFLWAASQGYPRAVSTDVVRFLRKEQTTRLLRLFGNTR